MKFKIRKKWLKACGMPQERNIFSIITIGPPDSRGIQYVTVDNEGFPWVVDSRRARDSRDRKTCTGAHSMKKRNHDDLLPIRGKHQGLEDFGFAVLFVALINAGYSLVSAVAIAGSVGEFFESLL